MHRGRWSYGQRQERCAVENTLREMFMRGLTPKQCKRVRESLGLQDDADLGFGRERHPLKFLTFIAVVIYAAAALGADVIVETYSSSNVTYITQGWDIIGQTFRAPAGNPTLQSWQLRLDPRPGGGVLRFSIYPWGGAAAIGPASYLTNV